MTRVAARLAARIRARAHRDERGFTMVEMILALSLVTAALVSLAYTATNGFRYIAFARERQAADQIANLTMEQVRGLAYSKIKQGLKTESLATDPYVESCSGTYRLHLPGTGTCAGEKIVSTSSLSNVTPIVPNNGTIGRTQGYPVDYTYRVYISNNCPSVGTGCSTATPYRATVYVSWDSPQMSGPAEYVQVQTYFWSPTGCVSSNTHPFAAPCQPFFYGQALMPAGNISVAGSVAGLTFTRGSLLTPEAESTLQQEQVSQVQGKLTPSATTLVDDDACVSPTCAGGSTSSRTTAADADPSGTTPTYSTSTLAAGPLSAYSTSGASNAINVTNVAGDSGTSQSAVTANASSPCPPNPPQASTETDSLPCGGSKMRQAGTLSMTMTLNGSSLGTGTVASIDAPSPATDSYTYANRQAISGQSGNIEDIVDRQIGRVNIGGLPANLTAPSGWDQAFIVVTGYHDRVFAAAGTSAATTTAAISAGTLKYWTGTGYTSINLANSGASGYNYSIASYDQSVTGTVGGKTVVVRMQLATGSPFKMGSAPTPATTSCGAGPCVSSATATIGSPVYGTFTYTVTVNGSTVASLSLTVDLGTITGKSTYQAAVAAG